MTRWVRFGRGVVTSFAILVTANLFSSVHAAEQYPTILFFDHSSAKLRDANLVQIKVAVRTHAEQDSKIFLVYGHTDRSGTKEQNQRLSLARARQVGEAIIKAGVAKDAIVFAACGAAYANRLLQRAWQDRKVELFVGTPDEVAEIQRKRLDCVDATM
jgi:hypothetical protein